LDLVHDAENGARTAATLYATPQAAVELGGVARALTAHRDSGADIMIAQYIARTDNHGWALVAMLTNAIDQVARSCKRKV